MGLTVGRDSDSEDAAYTFAHTTTELEAIADDINTVEKFAGKPAYNTTTDKPCWAVGAAAGDLWVNADGTTAHTPS